MPAPWILPLSSCGPRGVALERGPVWIVGIARAAKLGPVVSAPGLVVRCRGRAPWRGDELGTAVVVAGTLAWIEHAPLPIGPHGERSAGAEGRERVIAPGVAPLAVDAADDDGLLAAALAGAELADDVAVDDLAIGDREAARVALAARGPLVAPTIFRSGGIGVLRTPRAVEAYVRRDGAWRLAAALAAP